VTDGAAPWACPTCANVGTTRYCSICGERRIEAHELTLRGLGTQILHALTSVDGKLIRSFIGLFSRPGYLTVAYLSGQRTAFLGPVPLFLMANVLFFATESLLGGTIFTTPLDGHLNTQPWSGLAETLVDQRLTVLGTTVALYAPVFDRAVALHARSLIILMALSFSLLPGIVFWRGKHPAVAHAVFALHLYAFLLPLLCVVTAIQAADARLGGAGFASRPLDLTLVFSSMLACAAYLYVATAAVYGAHGWRRVVQVAVC
jgi:hypothetical protein